MEVDAIELYRNNLDCLKNSDEQLEARRRQREKDREMLKRQQLEMQQEFERDMEKEREGSFFYTCRVKRAGCETRERASRSQISCYKFQPDIINILFIQYFSYRATQSAPKAVRRGEGTR